MNPDEEDLMAQPHLIKGDKDIEYFTDWLKKSEIVKAVGFKYYSEIQYSELNEKVRLSTLEEVEKELIEEIGYLEHHVKKANEGIRINVERVESWIFQTKSILKKIQELKQGGKE